MIGEVFARSFVLAVRFVFDETASMAGPNQVATEVDNPVSLIISFGDSSREKTAGKKIFFDYVLS